MGTHEDPMGTNGRAMGTQGDPWGPWGGGGGGEGPLTPIFDFWIERTKLLN